MSESVSRVCAASWKAREVVKCTCLLALQVWLACFQLRVSLEQFLFASFLLFTALTVIQWKGTNWGKWHGDSRVRTAGCQTQAVFSYIVLLWLGGTHGQNRWWENIADFNEMIMSGLCGDLLWPKWLPSRNESVTLVQSHLCYISCNRGIVFDAPCCSETALLICQ